MAHRIILEEYDPAWPAEFEKIKRELDSVLGSTVLAIEHVGSTSVPGLVAKLIIDIDVVIDGCFDETRRILESAGYRHEGDLGIEGREAFSYVAKAHLMNHHLYVCDVRSTELLRHLSFRNLLRTDETARNEYARVKQAAAALHPHDVDAYTSNKGPFVEKCLERHSTFPTITCLRDRPDLAEAAARWFHGRWGVPAEAYLESIGACTARPAEVPQWYVVLGGGGGIVAGCGVIENDFHNRPDLSPNLCALFVEEGWRGRGLARRLVNFARHDVATLGRTQLYLITDHVGLYERYGWEFVCMVEDGEAQPTRLYRAPAVVSD